MKRVMMASRPWCVASYSAEPGAKQLAASARRHAVERKKMSANEALANAPGGACVLNAMSLLTVPISPPYSSVSYSDRSVASSGRSSDWK